MIRANEPSQDASSLELNTRPIEIPKIDGIDVLLQFLEIPGHVLLIQGPPGTGKTTLALEVLSRLEYAHKIYTSSRVSPVKLRQHFPWIEEVIDSMSGRVAKAEWLDEVHELRVAEADNVFNRVLTLKQSRKRAVLVIDSWEGALRNTNEEGRRMLETAVLGHLDESRVSAIIVSESGKLGDLGYLVDGVINLDQAEVDGRLVRTLTISKLRGIRVSKRKALFSLDGSRFRSLAPTPCEGVPNGQSTLVPVPNSETHFSTGSVDLDRLFGSGIRRGSCLLIDTDPSVPPLALRAVLNIMRANFIAQGGSCFVVPMGTFSSENTADSLRPLVGEKAFDERVRITEFNQALPPKKWRLQLKGDLLQDVHTFYNAWNDMLKTSTAGMINVSFDKVVQVYGEEPTLPGFTELGEMLRDSGALNVAVASRDTKVREGFLRTADYHLKVHNVEGSFVLYGIKPLTSVYGASLTFEKGYPSLSLTEVV